MLQTGIDTQAGLAPHTHTRVAQVRFPDSLVKLGNLTRLAPPTESFGKQRRKKGERSDRSDGKGLSPHRQLGAWMSQKRVPLAVYCPTNFLLLG